MIRKTQRLLLIGTAFALVFGVVAFLVAVPASAQGTAPTPCPYGNMPIGGMMGGGMMGGQNGMMGGSNQSLAQPCPQTGGMMGGGMMGGQNGMMGGNGMMSGGMMGNMMNMMNMMGGGMMNADSA